MNRTDLIKVYKWAGYDTIPLEVYFGLRSPQEKKVVDWGKAIEAIGEKYANGDINVVEALEEIKAVVE